MPEKSHNADKNSKTKLSVLLSIKKKTFKTIVAKSSTLWNYPRLLFGNVGRPREIL